MDHFDFQSRTPEPFSASSLQTPYSFKGPAKLYEIVPSCKIRVKSPRPTTPLATGPFFSAISRCTFSCREAARMETATLSCSDEPGER